MKPIYTHDTIRHHLENRIRPSPRPRPSFQELAASQWSPLFERYMRNRLIMGGIRYETFDEKRSGHTYNLIEYAMHKIQLYKETGNQECLVDAANILMIEFEAPTHPTPHFTPLDDQHHCTKD